MSTPQAEITIFTPLVGFLCLRNRNKSDFSSNSRRRHALVGNEGIPPHTTSTICADGFLRGKRIPKLLPIGREEEFFNRLGK
ncbi:hypothetical protein CEXT_429241 [Caerostris extrusa]|uniref:Uncharacterized protein n=1 Tax=Caerostris extrusa TaxID=172846 RepID=A0AAV4MX83_CAEEX|nr:hypothetical protein CEXT_429241 [Caerostris extrusa]